MKIFSALVNGAIGLFVLFSLYVIFVWLPVSMYAEADCLRNGYPKAKVSVGLERYCVTLDGLVTVKVDKR